MPLGERTMPSSRKVPTCRPALPGGRSVRVPACSRPTMDANGSRRAILGSLSVSGSFGLAEAAGLGALFGAGFLALRFADGADFASCVAGFGEAGAGFAWSCAAGLVTATAGGLDCAAAAGALAFAATCAAGFACGWDAVLVVAVAGLACASKPGPAAPSKIPSASVFTEPIFPSFRLGFPSRFRRARRYRARIRQLGKVRGCRKYAGHRGARTNRILGPLAGRRIGNGQVADVDDPVKPHHPP